MNELSNDPIYELPYTKAVLKPIIDATEAVAAALSDGRIDFKEWVAIAWQGIPLVNALKSLQHFIAETKVLNSHPEARQQLYEWFAAELNLDLGKENIEWIIENTIKYALQTWSYIVGMQKHLVAPKQALKKAETKANTSKVDAKKTATTTKKEATKKDTKK